MGEEPAGRGIIIIKDGKSEMLSLGIMQGRLTPSKKRGIQFFPFENWQKEFYSAAEIGLNEIEWIFDCEKYQENPIWTDTGLLKVKETIANTGVKINSICFDYFMRVPFYKLYGDERSKIFSQNCEMTYKVLDSLAELGGRLLEIPIVDNSSVKTTEEEKMVSEYIQKIAERASEFGINIGLETDFPPGKFKEFLEGISGNYIYANFDSGNSSGLGYDAMDEIGSLKERIYNVHIKDRVYQGTTVKLGTGSADFDKVFSALKKVGYQNSFILQAARGEEGKEEDNIMEQMRFVKGYINKYEL